MVALCRIALLAFLTFLAPALAAEEPAGPVDVTRLMAAGPLPEMTMGDPAAPVTVVEYASLTCSHCGRFQQTVFDAFKAKYIDTGKVYFVLREFPLDQLAFVAILSARCLDTKEFFPLVDELFKDQANWAFVEDPGKPLLAHLAKHGMDEAAFKACLGKSDLIEGIIAVQDKGTKDFGISGTPTFFINGVRHVGEMSLEEADKIIEPMLAPKAPN